MNQTKENFSKTLGMRLRDKRGRLTIKEVAEKLGVHRNTVWAMETKGKVPDAWEIIQLARIYNTTSDFLLTGSISNAGTTQAIKIQKEQFGLFGRAIQFIRGRA